MMRSVIISCAIVLLGACAAAPTEHPCGEVVELGCSIPTAVLIIEDYREQANKFHDACVTHDLCYRHGAATYDLDRKDCDDGFYEDMKTACSGLGGLGILNPEDYAKCQLAALETYEAVRKHGEERFRSTASTVCEYR